MDQPAWEQSKENVQPRKRGRNVGRLTQALRPSRGHREALEERRVCVQPLKSAMCHRFEEERPTLGKQLFLYETNSHVVWILMSWAQ